MGHHDRRGGFSPAAHPEAASDPLKPEHVGEPAPGVAREGFAAAAATGAAGWTAASAFFRAPSGAALTTFPAVLTGTTATLGRKPEWIFQRGRRQDEHRWVQPQSGEADGRAPRERWCLRRLLPHPKSQGSPLSGGDKTLRGDCACVKVIRLDSCDAQGTIFLVTAVAFPSPWPQPNKDLRSLRPGWSLGGSGATRKTSRVSIYLNTADHSFLREQFAFLVYILKMFVFYLNDKML